MTIKTWSSFSKRRNSTKQPTGGTDRTVTLKHPTSVIRPVFLIQAFSLSDNYLKWNDRYYFIDDIVVVNDSMAEYHCTVDALASWKTGIGNSSEYVVRSASASDEYVMDMLYPVKAGVPTVNVDMDNTQTGEITPTQGSIVIGVVAGNSALNETQTGAVTFYHMMDYQERAFMRYMFETQWLDTQQTDLSLATQKQLINPFQYVVSAMWFPFERPYEIDNHIIFGWWESDVPAHRITPYERITTYSGDITPTQHPEAATRGKYLNNAPYTTRDFYIWGFGKIVLDPANFVHGETLHYNLDIDLCEGSGCLVLTATLNGVSHDIGKYVVPWGVPVQIGQVTQDVMGAQTQVIQAAQSTLHLNFAGSSAAVDSAVNSQYPRLSTIGSTGTIAKFNPSVPMVVSEFRVQTPADVTQNGRPLCQQKTINTLSGYIKTENADVDLPCTQEERDQIASYMNGGFFYE